MIQSTDRSLIRALEHNTAQVHVWRAVQIQRHQPWVCCVHKSVRAPELTHILCNLQSAWIILLEVDVEDVVDEADARDAVVADVKMVLHEEYKACI